MLCESFAQMRRKDTLPGLFHSLWNPANIKGPNKHAKFLLEGPRPCTIFCFALITLYDYVTKTFLLVTSLVRSKQLLCFVHGQGQKSEQKSKTKKFVGFHNYYSQLTMVVRKPVNANPGLKVSRTEVLISLVYVQCFFTAYVLCSLRFFKLQTEG